MRLHLQIAGLAVCLTAAATAVAWAVPQANTTYEGTTSQGNDASLRTSSRGTGLTRFVIRREFDCGEETVVGTFRTRREEGGVIPVRANGEFFAHARVEPGGAIRRGVFTLRGEFGPKGNAARGTYRERVRLKNGTRCDTETVRFRVAAED